jgi:hypothetical protein
MRSFLAAWWGGLPNQMEVVARVLLILVVCGSANSALARWVDTKTGQPVVDRPIVAGPGQYPYGKEHHVVQADPSDPNRAYCGVM